MSWGDEDTWYKWWIVVTNSDEHRFEALLAKDDSYSWDEAIRERREISYELSWDDSGRFLTWSNSTGKEGTAYFTGNFVFYSPKSHMVGEKAQPLTDEIKQKMQIHPDMMEAASSISGHVVLTGRSPDQDCINLREDVLLLVRSHFRTRGTLMSFGPVIIEDGVDIREVKSAKWVFLDSEYSQIRRFTAERVYVLESDFFQSEDWKKSEMFENCKEFTLISRKDLSEK